MSYGGLFVNSSGRGIIHDSCPHLYSVWENVPVVEVFRYHVRGWAYAYAIATKDFTDGSRMPLDDNGGYTWYYDRYGSRNYYHANANKPRIVGDTSSYDQWAMNHNRGKVEYKGVHTYQAGYYGKVQYYNTEIVKYRAFLPSIAGVGSPVTASMTITDNAVYAIDSIEPTNGGYYVYLSGTTPMYLAREANSPLYQNVDFTRSIMRYQNQKIYDRDYNRLPSASGVTVNGYAGYTDTMRDGDLGMSVRRGDGVELFRFPAKYRPVTTTTGGAKELPSVEVFSSFSVGDTKTNKVIFFGASQRKDIYDTGLYYYSENGRLKEWQYDCRVIWSRQFISRDGVVYSLPVANDFTGGITVITPSYDGLVFGLGSYGGTVSTYNANINSSGSIVVNNVSETAVFVL